MTTLRPPQKLSYKEKITKKFSSGNDKEKSKTWGEINVDFNIESCSQNAKRHAELSSLYLLRDDTLVDANYKYVINPYNSDNIDYQRFPAKLRNYPIINPIIDLLLGEMAGRYVNPIVVNGSKNTDNSLKDGLKKVLNDTLMQQFINEVNASGVDTGVESKETPKLNDVAEQYISNYDNIQALEGQQALDYINFDQDLTDKWQKCFEHWLLGGAFYTIKNVVNDDIQYKPLHPLDCFHPNPVNSDFCEDLDLFVVREKTTVAAILDEFYDELTSDEVSLLDKNTSYSASISGEGQIVYNGNLDGLTSSGNSETINSNVVLWRTFWVSFQKVGLLTTVDKETGEPVEVEVDETYKLNKEAGDIEIKWLYLNEAWEGARIDLDNNTRLYKRVRPSIVQRNKLSNKSKCCIPIGGRIDSTTNGGIKSIFKSGVPFQELYNALHFSMEKTIHKNKDKITTIPMGLIPDKAGWSVDKFMYMTDALGYMFFDESKPNAASAIQAIKVLDANLGQYIGTMKDILASVKEELWDLVGMNRQRFGDVMASDGKAVNQDAISRSSTITKELFRKFEKGKEKDLNGLLDCSKIAWINGKKGEYINSNGKKAIIDIDPYRFVSTEYNVFCFDGGVESQKIQEAKNLLLSRNQTTMKDSTALEILDSTNMARVKEYVLKAEKAAEDLIAAQEEAAKQQELAMQESANAIQEKAIELQKYKTDSDYNKTIDAKILETESREKIAEMTGEDVKEDNNDNGDSEFEKQLKKDRLAFDKQKHSDSMAIKEKQLTISAKKKETV